MIRRFIFVPVFIAAAAVAPFAAPAAEKAPESKPSDIPGITTPDRTPLACVNCHANHPEMKKDHRLTTLLAGWIDKSDSAVVVMAKAAAPKGVVLQGKHPDIAGKVKIVPADCLKCHKSDSEYAPPFKRLLHAIHLSGGTGNGFIKRGNNCTSCHKLDQKTGAVGVGSGEEK